MKAYAITLHDFSPDFAAFSYEGVEYTITYNQDEILTGEVEHISDYGYPGFHTAEYSEPTWDDVDSDVIKEFITEHKERWEHEKAE